MAKNLKAGKQSPLSSGLVSFHVTHRWADPATLKAAVAVAVPAILDGVGGLAGVRGCVALVTCDRAELYVETDGDPSRPREVRAYFQSPGYRSGVEAASSMFGPVRSGRILRGQRTLHHLCRMASGLDSKLVGEPEILGQVRAAVRQAEERGRLSPGLLRAFESAVRVGRAVRRLPGFESTKRSWGAAINGRLGGAARGRVLVVGAGQVARSVLASAPSRNQFVLANRSPVAARRLGREYGIPVVPLARANKLADEWASIVWAIPASPDRVLGRRLRTSVLFDLRPGANGSGSDRIQAATRVRMEDFSGVGVPLNPSLAQEAKRLVVRAAANEWARWETVSSAKASLLRRIHEKARRIEDHEVERALRRLSHLTPHDHMVVRTLARSLRMRLYLDPTLVLNRVPHGKDDEIISAAARLFGVRSATGGGRSA
jgi:glutamyl-tRNA reductase